MSAPHVEILDHSDPEKIREYENAFYKSFLRLSNPGIRGLWDWDDESRRIKAKIPYEHQRIYYVRDHDGKMGSAIAFNISQEFFQSSAYDFQRPDGLPSFEIVTLFASSGNTMNKVHMLERARNDFFNEFAYCYATCGERVLPLHVRIGAEILGKSEVNGQLRYFLRYDLKRPFIRYN